MRILFSKEPVKEIVCGCGCNEPFKPTDLKHVYKSAGCSNRAKLAGQKRRRANKKGKPA